MLPIPFRHPAFTGLIGVGRAVITPPVGIYSRSWGAARHDVAEGVHRPFTVTALAIRASAEEQPFIIVSLDLGWWQAEADEWHVRGALIGELGVEADKVLVHLAHTHAGPSLCREDADKPGGQFIAPYLDTVRDRTLAAVREALASARPAVLEWHYGHCDLAVNRDLPDPEKPPRYLVGSNPEAAADDTLLLGRASSVEDGRVLATMVNYACHPTSLAWDNRLLSPDYVGAMREVVETHTGAPCLFLLGAAGDLSPRECHLGDAGIADANGRRLGYAAVATLESMLPPRTQLRFAGAVESGASIGTWARAATEPSSIVKAKLFYLKLALKEMPPVEAILEEAARCTDRVMAERLKRKARVRRGIGEATHFELPVWVWQLGDCLLVAQREEAYSVFQQALRKRYPHLAVAVMNVTNGGLSYLAPAELYDEDIYPVWQSPYARGGYEALLEATLAECSGMLAAPHDEGIQS